MCRADEPPETDPARVYGAALELAGERLGPESERVVAAADVQALLLSRMRAGVDLEDAVLAEAHRAARTNPRVADEFVGYFLADLLRLGGMSISPNLRRYLDTGDLVQSVLGDLWPELAGVRFETRGRFLAYMSRRLGWKAAGKARKLVADRRREDLRVDVDAGALAVASEEASPASRAAANEDRDRLILRLLKLPERDRELLTRHLRGESVESIAQALELTRDAAYKALQRAVRKARSMR